MAVHSIAVEHLLHAASNEQAQHPPQHQPPALQTLPDQAVRQWAQDLFDVRRFCSSRLLVGLVSGGVAARFVRHAL